MALNVAADDTAERSHEVVDLSGRGTADGVSDTDSVDTDLVDGSVEREKVDQVWSERVLWRESDFETLGLDELDDLNGSVLGIELVAGKWNFDSWDATYLDVSHVLAVRVLSQERAGANDNIDTVNTGLDSNLDIVHVAADVSQDLGLETELADGLAVETRLLRGTRRGELDAVNTELVQSLGDLDLGLGVKVGIGKLLALTQRRLDDLEVWHVGQEVAYGLVGVLVDSVRLGLLLELALELGEAIVSFVAPS
jgi:hypothetical protein